MALIKSSDLANWYKKLNAIRNKDGINLGNETVETVDKSNIISIGKIKNLQNKINSLKTNTYLNYASFSLKDTDEIDNNTIISDDIKKNIDDTLTSLESICANDTTLNQSESTFSTQVCSTYSNYANNTNRAIKNVGNTVYSNKSNYTNRSFTPKSNDSVTGNSNCGSGICYGTVCDTETDCYQNRNCITRTQNTTNSNNSNTPCTNNSTYSEQSNDITTTNVTNSTYTVIEA